MEKIYPHFTYLQVMEVLCRTHVHAVYIFEDKNHLFPIGVITVTDMAGFILKKIGKEKEFQRLNQCVFFIYLVFFSI